ncbi:MAG: META domain-containing protein [Polyangiales bacterium]
MRLDRTRMDESPTSSEVPAPLRGEWHVQDIVGRPILEEALAMIQIESDGRFSGRTGCNHITGSVDASADTANVTFAGIAMTRMLCPPALMDQERRFVQALEAARAYRVDDDGQLHLQGEYEPFLLRASRSRVRPPHDAGL